jgi:hypothetical protein
LEAQGTDGNVGSTGTLVGGRERARNHSMTTPASKSASAQHKILKSPMRELVRSILYFVYAGEATASDVKSSINARFDDDDLPRTWKIQVRDVLKHDPEIEKTDDDTWVLRTPSSDET